LSDVDILLDKVESIGDVDDYAKEGLNKCCISPI